MASIAFAGCLKYGMGSDQLLVLGVLCKVPQRWLVTMPRFLQSNITPLAGCAAQRVA